MVCPSMKSFHLTIILSCHLFAGVRPPDAKPWIDVASLSGCRFIQPRVRKREPSDLEAKRVRVRFRFRVEVKSRFRFSIKVKSRFR